MTAKTESKWLPIESAPRDGTVFLAWRFYAVAVRRSSDPEYAWDAVSLGGIADPLGSNGFMDGDPNLTHWQPLPEPPHDR